MTTYHSPTAETTSATSPAPRNVAAVGVLSALAGAAWSFYGAHDWAEITTVVVSLAVVTAVVYGFVMPRVLRRPDQGNASLALSVPAVLLTMPAFWSGLPLVLGLAGMIAGNTGRQRATGSGRSIAGLALGALAVTGYLTIFIWDGVLLGHAGFLFD